MYARSVALVFFLGTLLAAPLWAHDAEHPPIYIWSTQPNGGQLTTNYDFSRIVEIYQSCFSGGVCLYTNIEPGFITDNEEDVPDDQFYPLADGTNVTLEIVAIEGGLTLRVFGNGLSKVGDKALLGTAPALHNHPSWQLVTDSQEPPTLHISYRLTTDSPLYSNSDVFRHTVVGVIPTPETPTPTPTPEPCAGDCDDSGSVTVDEILQTVNAALGVAAPCTPADLDGNGTITVDEIIASVSSALDGCAAATPPPVSLHEIQEQIFTPKCATALCHNAEVQTGGLVLDEGRSWESLVGATPFNLSASSAGLLRVDAGNPGNSFLLVKVGNPRPEQGSRMPIDADPLSAEEIALIRNWVLNGAPNE